MYKTIDPIEAIDRAYNQGIDTWEMMVAMGANDEDEMTSRRWRQGDLAMRVEKHYGEKTLSKYADSIGVVYSTLKQRCEMSRFYEKDTRVSYPLFYSHYREAMRFNDLERALKSLDKATVRDWPIWKLKRFIDRCLGKNKLINENAEGIVQGWKAYGGKHIIEISVSENDMKHLIHADKVIIRAK